MWVKLTEKLLSKIYSKCLIYVSSQSNKTGWDSFLNDHEKAKINKPNKPWEIRRMETIRRMEEPQTPIFNSENLIRSQEYFLWIIVLIGSLQKQED